MKKIFICMVVLVGFSALQVNAFDWNSALNFITRASEAQTTETVPSTLTDLEKQMSAIDNSVQTAFVNIVSELSGWKETRSVKSQLKSNNAILTEIISDYTNTYLANNKQNIINTIKKMSAKEKTALINNLSTLTESGQKYLLLATNGAKTATNTLKAAKNVSEVANTVASINKTAVELRSRASAVYSFAKQIKTVADSAGVSLN